MSTSTGQRPALRILQEGFGPGAWHGPDLKAALADVTSALAYWRPAAGRHNIAEVALHHAYTVRSVVARLTGEDLEPFVLEGEDWFEVNDERRISWAAIKAAVESGQERLRDVLEKVEGGTREGKLTADERFELALGITCHAVYHAGQIQLLKRLHER